MTINDQPRDPESIPYSAFERIPSFTMQNDVYVDGEEKNEVEDHIIGALKECIEEIDIKGKELIKKVVSKYVEIPLGRLAREAIGDDQAKDFLGKIVSKVGNKIKAQKGEDFVVYERGVSIDDEFSQKLERFKVKTVNIGGVVVKEDQK